jgi:hypothetical protein
MGHIITHDFQGVNPYPSGSFANAIGSTFGVSLGGSGSFFGISRSTKEENPWYEWVDPTFGAIGWTSTPGFSLAGIPDLGKAIIESKVGILDFLVQSTQGSIIVQGTTTKDPNSENGSGRMELLSCAKYTAPENKEVGKNLKFDLITQYPAAPERGLSIGNCLQEIEGTGKWVYTGTFNDITLTLSSGMGYIDGSTAVCYPRRPLGVAFSYKEVILTVIGGNITGYTVTIPGSGYIVGEIVDIIPLGTIYNMWSPGSIHTIESGEVARINVNPLVLTQLNGTNYYSNTVVECFNLTKNQMVVKAFIVNPFMNGSISLTQNQGFVQNITVVPDPFIAGYPVGTKFYIMNYNKSEKYTKSGPLAIAIVETNDGLGNITVGIEGTFNGDLATYATGEYMFSTQRLGQIPPIVSIIADTNGQLTDVKLVDFGLGNSFGDKILIVQDTSDKNGAFELISVINDTSLVFPKMVRGGIGYSYLQPTAMNSPIIQNNSLGTYPNLQIIPEYLMTMAPTDQKGSIDIVTFTMILGSSPTFNSYPPDDTLVAPFEGLYNILFRPFIPSIVQPGGFFTPPENLGWYNNDIKTSAVFKAKAYPRLGYLQNSGYSTGIYTTSGGSGTGMTIIVEQVTTTGQVISVVVDNPGTGYLLNDKLTLIGGDSLCFVYLEYANSLQIYNQGFLLVVTGTIMNFGFKVLNPGTGYAIGSTYSTVCPNRQGVGFIVNIVDVDGSGSARFIKLVNNGNFYYQIGDVITVQGGNNDCILELSDPDEIEPIEMVSNGNNYITGTATLVNVTSNALNLFCDVTGGNCIAFNYNNTDLKPEGWNLGAYNVGDQLRLVQRIPNDLGVPALHDDAIIEITFIDYDTQAISFITINPGSGYEPSPVDGTFGVFIPTVKLPAFETGHLQCDIVADTNGGITSITNLVQLDSAQIQYSDFFYVNQGTNTPSCVVQLRPFKDVSAPWELSENGRIPTHIDWNKYNDVMKTSVNLMDSYITIDTFPGYPNYMNNSYYVAGDGGMKYDKALPKNFIVS